MHTPQLLIISQCYGPQIGGIQQLMTHLASGLHPHHPVTVITPTQRNQQPWDSQQSYPIIRVPGPRFWRRRCTRRWTQQLILNHAIGAIITDSWKSAKTIQKIARKQRIPILCLAHGNDVLDKNKTRRRLNIRRTLQACDRVIAVSHDTQKHVLAHGIHHCQVIHSGINLARPARTTIHYPRPLLLTIARLEPRKGHDQVLRALPHLIQHWPNLHYVIAGSGDDRPRLQQLIQQYQLQQHVSMLGRIDEAHKAQLLQQADLFVMPVRTDTNQHSIEGFGMALAEAQLAGLTVLTGTSGGVLDVVANNTTGFTCDGQHAHSVQQRLHDILADPQLRQRCARQGQQFAQKHFTTTTMIQQYRSLLTQLHAFHPSPTQTSLT